MSSLPSTSCKRTPRDSSAMTSSSWLAGIVVMVEESVERESGWLRCPSRAMKRTRRHREGRPRRSEQQRASTPTMKFRALRVLGELFGSCRTVFVGLLRPYLRIALGGCAGDSPPVLVGSTDSRSSGTPRLLAERRTASTTKSDHLLYMPHTASQRSPACDSAGRVSHRTRPLHRSFECYFWVQPSGRHGTSTRLNADGRFPGFILFRNTRVCRR